MKKSDTNRTYKTIWSVNDDKSDPKGTDLEKRSATYSENCNERPLEESDKHVAPMMFIIGHAGVTYVHGEGHQEELDGWPQETSPFCIESSLDVEL